MLTGDYLKKKKKKCVLHCCSHGSINAELLNFTRRLFFHLFFNAHWLHVVSAISLTGPVLMQILTCRLWPAGGLHTVGRYEKM